MVAPKLELGVFHRPGRPRESEEVIMLDDVKVVKVDKNGTTTYGSGKCPRCGGRGFITFSSLDNSRCWECGGSGYHYHEWKEYTPEYAQKLAERRLAKARKLAPEKNARYWSSLGLAEDGSAWVAINKYAKADEMKPLGAKWCPTLGWHFPEEHDGCFKVTADEVGEYEISGMWNFKTGSEQIVDEMRSEYLPKPAGDYIGEVGEKLEVKAVFQCEISYEAVTPRWGQTEIRYILKFKCGDNVIVWKTSTINDLTEGNSYKVRGAVKDHNEYRGEKQTVLTRCKIEEA